MGATRASIMLSPSPLLLFNASVISLVAWLFLPAMIGSSAMSPFFTITIVVFLLIGTARIAWLWYIYPHYWSPIRHLPGPPDKPSVFMGHFFLMLEGGPGQVLRSWANSVPNDGLIRYLDFFNWERVAVVGPAALAEVLVHKCYDFEKPPQLRKGISRILGLGLFLSEGDVHKKQRKNLMPAFSYRHVKDLYPIFWSKSVELVAAIKASQHTDMNLEYSECIEVNQWASRETLDIIGLGGFGQSFNAIQDPNNALSRTYRSLFVPGRTGQILGVLGFLLPQFLVRRLPFLRNDRMKQSSDFIRSFCRSSVEAKRQKLKLETKDRLDILTVALESGGFSDEELVDQMMTFLAAGHETTASALTWTVYLLCKHPQTQQRLRDEMHSILPHPSDPTTVVTSDMIEKLPYLNAVCRESLRLFPPVAVTIRIAVRDTIIANQAIPKGTNITIPPWAVNCNTAIWGQDAEEFRPERWLEVQQNSRTTEDQTFGSSGDGMEAKRRNTNYDFMTFLHGPRSCIGQAFAMGELKCLVAAWVGAFETELEDKDLVPIVKGGITAKPRDGLWVRVKPIE
ncbi:MAG: hypothetical protein Q9174_005166 [Haloplaca sp. 1 TL-2023]